MYEEAYLTFDVRGAIVTHMQENPDQEVCGVIVKTRGKFKYERCVNVHENANKIDPETERPFDVVKFDPATSLRIWDQGSNVVAYVHTHPHGPIWPSLLDQQMQQDIGKPAVICARDPIVGTLEVFSYGDHLLEADLYGRLFRHAVFDCMEAIRSWVWQNEGYKIAFVPRENFWWDEGKLSSGAIDPDLIATNANLYEVNFPKEGYVAFEPNLAAPGDPLHPRVGDIILMQLDAPVINHAAVYVGNNQIYHHRVNKKSGNAPLGYLLQNGYVRKWVRRAGEVS